jgi:hypothetical protein
VISTVPSTLSFQAVKSEIARLTTALSKLPGIFAQGKTNPLVPRPALNYFASISCGLFLLEHAIWSSVSLGPSDATDIEAFCRWIEEGDLEPSLQDIERVSQDRESRVKMDKQLVFRDQKAKL